MPVAATAALLRAEALRRLPTARLDAEERGESVSSGRTRIETG
jgi:hypothetical protein